MIELGLSRITSLLKLSPHPCTWKAIHITGTNGKGSVAAYLSSLLFQTGIRVGRFTSPHLIHRWDCISVNQSTVPQNLFLEVEQQIQARNLAHGIKATEFEILTATAFEVFQRQDVQVGVVECGLGGLRDATNALGQEDVLVSVVTKIGLDHVDFLGGTVEEIAWEKSGIFRKGTPVVVDGSNLAEVIKVLERRKNETQTGDLIVASPSWLDRYVHGQKGEERIRNLPLHQRQNLAVALKAFGLASRRIPDGSPQSFTSRLDTMSVSETSSIPLAEHDTNTTTPTVTDHRINLEKTVVEVQRTWQGRLQWLDISSIAPARAATNPILLDGAHNTQSAEVLREYIDRHLRRDTPMVSTPQHDTESSDQSDTSQPQPKAESEPQSQSQSQSQLQPQPQLQSYHHPHTHTQPQPQHHSQTHPESHSHPQFPSSTTPHQDSNTSPSGLKNQTIRNPSLPSPADNEKGRITFLISLKSDKPPSSFVPLLIRPQDRVVTTSFPPVEGMPWVKPFSAAQLAEKIRQLGIENVTSEESVSSGLNKAVEIADGGGLVVAGSLYLVGEVLRLIESRKKSGIGMEG